MNVCVGCDHSMDVHVQAVSERVICLATSTHTTTGVIMTTTERCDCINFVSERIQNKRDAEQAERARWDKIADDIRVLRVGNFTITDE